MAAEANENHNKATTVNIPENAVTTLTVEEIYNKEQYDLSTMEEDDVFKLLNAAREGLTDKEANKRLKKFGYNRFDQRKENPLMEFLLFLWNPLSWVMEVAALVAIVVSNGDGKPPNWEDFLGILLLLLTNSVIGFVQQRHTENFVKALMKELEPEAKVKRNGKWKVIEAAELVPGDIINIKLGDVIPADGRLIATYGGVLIDQGELTGELLPVNKSVGDEIFGGTRCKQGEAEAIVISTGRNMYFGRGVSICKSTSNKTAHLQIILERIGYICIVGIIIFMIAQVLVMYAVFHYNYRRGIDNLLVLLIGGIPIVMPTVLSVIGAIGAKQLSKHHTIVTHVTDITELGAVTILCVNKTGTLTSNKPLIDKPSVKTYSNVVIDDIIHYAAIASQTENQDAIDACVIAAYGGIDKIREGIEELVFKPFNPTDRRTEITYKLISDGSIHRVSKGISHVIMDLCIRDKTNEQIRQFNADADEFAQRGLQTLAVAIEDVASDDVHGEGNGFKLIGLLPVYDPPRSDTKEAINRALQLNVKVKMITSDQLTIAKETGRRFGIGDNMFLSKTLRDGPPSQSGYQDVDDLVLHANGFASVYPEHKYEIVDRLQQMGYSVAVTGDSVNDTPALAKANIGVAVADASGAARLVANIILTEPGLSVIIEAILSSRQIFQRMRNYTIYTCSITIRIIVGFSILIFAFKFDFPSFMILSLAVVNDGTIMIISKDRVQLSLYPNSWNLSEIFTYAIVYGIYLAASTIAFFSIIVKTSFFQDKFNVEHFHYNNLTMNNPGWNDPKLHSIIYLQVSTISQALIFVIRSRSSFFLERPSMVLVCAFCIAQLIATFIAVWADWSFASIHGCGWHWAGIVWIWNIIWFFPLGFLKFALHVYLDRKQKQTVKEILTTEPPIEVQNTRRKSKIANTGAKYYEPHTEHLSVSYHYPNFAPLLKIEDDDMTRITIDLDGLSSFPLVQAHEASELFNAQGENLDRRTTTAV